MSIKFIYKEEEKKSGIRLCDVKQDQFFIDQNGNLCQKRTCNSYIQIADVQGRPNARFSLECDAFTPVLKILPKVVRITWDEEE